MPFDVKTCICQRPEEGCLYHDPKLNPKPACVIAYTGDTPPQQVEGQWWSVRWTANVDWTSASGPRKKGDTGIHLAYGKCEKQVALNAIALLTDLYPNFTYTLEPYRD